MTSLYSLVAIGDAFRITRFDADLNPESTYELDSELCTCPAGTKQTCRHRKMLPLFEAAGHVNDGWFLDWDTRLWRRPLAEVSDMFDDQETKCGGLADDTTIPALTNLEEAQVELGFYQPELIDPALPSNSPAQAEVASPPPPTPQPASATSLASAPAAGGKLFRRRVT